jgi:hypothetical protein
MLHIVVSLTDNSRGVVYDCNIYIIRPAVLDNVNTIYYFTKQATLMSRLIVQGLPLR